MSMTIRPAVVWLDANGNPAVDFKVYIGQVNTDPRDPAKQLTLTDSATGEVVSNPFVINPDGYPKNQNSQIVLPTIQDQEYSVLMVSPGGGIQYAYPKVIGDAFGLTTGGGGTSMVGEVYNNFPAAQSADLTAFKLIFIQSKTSGWEGTATGPEYSYYSYFTGGVGSPETGTFDLFYDSQGNEWKITENSQLPLTNEADIATNAADIATNADDITTLSGVVADTTVKSTKVTVITATDAAWAPDPNTLSMSILAVGGGGGGGGVPSITISQNAISGAGSGAGWAEKNIPSPTGTYNLVIGAKGAGGSVGGAGVDGGDTTATGVGIAITASGGIGGAAGVAYTASSGYIRTLGTDGGASSGGDSSGYGWPSTDSVTNNWDVYSASHSGGSFYGGAARGWVHNFTTPAPPPAALAYGAGGASTYEIIGTGETGGDGAQGVIVITEYLK